LAINFIQSITASAVSEDKSNEAIAEIETILRREHKLQEDDENDFEVRSQAK
jgi:putative ABC transport system permease protein